GGGRGGGPVAGVAREEGGEPGRGGGGPPFVKGGGPAWVLGRGEGGLNPPLPATAGSEWGRSPANAGKRGKQRSVLELAASAEVQRFPVGAQLADPVPAPGAGFPAFHVHRHEGSILLRLFVVRVGQDRLNRSREDQRDRAVKRLLLLRFQRCPPPQRQEARLEKDLVRVGVADPGQELLVPQQVLQLVAEPPEALAKDIQSHRRD